ncbi:MAG: alpha/beta fold hydrolase, partial [SAR324 cluster bacterium]|nr:alpha/beta fold hydrolase [SAR324 cluster bacterium]
MDCPRCHHSNPAEARFCEECGAQVERACPVCHHTNSPTARFCISCGRDLSTPESLAPPESPELSAPAGERRQATVLFSDLSGYTAMNEKLDPEEVEGIMSRIKGEAVRIVESHGGIVNQFVGDEVLALFGIPTAHEDDPRRAVRAALELHEAARRISPEAEEKIGRPLRMHTGIDTGLIVTSLRDDRDGRVGITGDTVNAGARLKALAVDDQILVSPETQRLIAPYFDTEALAPVQLKDKTGTLTPYRVAGESAVHSRLEASARRGFTAFAGREGELATLDASLERAVAGQGQLVAVVGEAGLGKSRLLYEFRRRLEPGRVTVLEGQCQTEGSNTPYLPLLDALRNGLNLGQGADPAEQLKIALATIRGIDRALEANLPLYLHLLSLPSDEHPLPPTLQGEELRREIQLALAALITLSAGRKPVVMFLEDWHWADEASAAALKYLAGVMARTPLLVVVTYRPELTADWGAPSHLTHLPLHPLDEPLSERIVKSALAADVLPDGLAALIYERTAGNPFFSEEICRALLEQGTVQVRAARQAVLTEPLESLALPDTVHAVIRSRLDRLEPELREVLSLAAVMGREFSGRVLERLHADKALLARCLEQLKALELIQQVRLLPDAGYVFKQVTTQEVAYETLLLQRRRALHLKAAEAIEDLYAERLSEFSELLGRHYRHGEAWAKAARYYLAATQTAKAHYAYQNALALCRRALEASEKEETLVTERGDILVLLGDLRSLLGELEPANARYEEALPLTDDPERKRWIENKVHRSGTVTRDGRKIVYYEHGSGGDTLLLFRPMTYGLATFQPVVEQLCQEFRVITFDPRGSGASDPVVRPYPIGQGMEDARAVIERTGSAPVIAVGLSMGAALLTLLAAAYPTLVKKLVMVSPSGILGKERKMKIPPELAEAIQAKDVARMVKVFTPSLFSEPGTEELAKEHVRFWSALPLDTILSFFLDRQDDEKARQEVPQLAIPTLVMHGTEDNRVPYENGVE